MNYMPNYVQSSPEPPPELRIQIETVLLRERSVNGLSRRCGSQNEITSKYKTRLESELQLIESKGYCSYFLIVADYIQWAVENNIAVGPGRGSGPCSVIAYSLGITNIDPIKYRLPFERFVNPERNIAPDFDLDFCSERCSEVTRYIQSRYGTDRVAQISSDCIIPLPERLIISSQPLADVVPLYKNPTSGIPATTLNLKQVAAHGLIQFNAIQQKALSVIQRAVSEIRKSGIELDINHINLNDKYTYRQLSLGNICEISNYDPPLFKQNLIEIQPENFNQLCAAIALYQPHLKEIVPQYLKQKQNPDAPGRHTHPFLQRITKETYGIVLYQEQLMDIAHEIAAFSYAKGDSFRRVLAKTDSKAIEQYKSEFISGATNSGLSLHEAKNALEVVMKSSQRLFNKSHAVSYALLTYQAAYLEANFPEQYHAVNT